MTKIRDYQREGIREIYDAWKSVRSVMFQMPTGTGKTVLFNQIVKQELEQNSTVLIIAHRQELIEQNEKRLRQDFQIEAGIIMANYPTNLSRPVQVASIQTLNRREYPSLNPSLIIIDEAHHVPAQSYVNLLNEYPKARILGVTATPIRLSGKGFTGLFDTLITSNSIVEFIKDGYLAPIRYLGRSKTFSKLDLSSVSIVEGDYAPNELSQKMRDEIVMANLIQSYLNHAKGEQMIVFAVDVDHSKDVTKRYKDEGFISAHLDAKTSKRERDEIISRFRTGEIQILSNVGIVSEGFDVPDCKVVQLARPTKSLAMYLQQVGRCMRKPEGKNYCIVLDNVGLYEDFGSPRSHRNWTLGATINVLPVSNSSSRDFDPLSRTKPEETDEDLIILEDFDMPIESETISKLLFEFEIDDELTELATENSDIAAILRTVKDNIGNFLGLPCYDVLLNVPNPLSVSDFTKNTSPLKGRQTDIIASVFTGNFKLPDKLESKIGFAEMLAYQQQTNCSTQEVEVWRLEQESTTIKINYTISQLAKIIDNEKLTLKLSNYQRLYAFVSKHDPSIFVPPVWEQERVNGLSELPLTIKNAILVSHQKALEFAPYIQEKDGNKIMINLDACNFTSIQGVNSLIAFMAKHNADKRTMPFWSYGMYEMIGAIRNIVNSLDLYFIISKFDSKIGSSNNVTQTTRNFLQLL